MDTKKKVLAICGSTRKTSANLQIIRFIAGMAGNAFEMDIYESLAQLPHFNPDMDRENEDVPPEVKRFRNKIAEADGVLICTPEYVFSLPGSLKNAIEWTVSTTLFSEKPVALITASGLGQKAHESLQLIFRTIYADVPEQAQLLISGVRSKINSEGNVVDAATSEGIKTLVDFFIGRLNKAM
jgi:chromate reductase